jgi:hypothetical protein
MVPLQYNFSRSYQIGHLNTDSLAQQLESWKQEQFPRFLDLCRSVYVRLLEEASPQYPFINWYSEVLQSSHANSLVRTQPKRFSLQSETPRAVFPMWL